MPMFKESIAAGHIELDLGYFAHVVSNMSLELGWTCIVAIAFWHKKDGTSCIVLEKVDGKGSRFQSKRRTGTYPQDGKVVHKYVSDWVMFAAFSQKEACYKNNVLIYL